ncbi:MAG: type II secretion system protein N [Comamonas sp.]
MAGGAAMNRGMSKKGKLTTEPARSNLGYGLAGAVTGAVLACVMLAPAAWLSATVDRATGGKVRLLNPTGTVWDGTAAWVLAASAGGASSLSLPSRVQWKIRPSSTGINLVLDTTCCMTSPVHLKVSPTSLHIASASLDMPLALLQGLGTPWNTLQLRGDLQLHWNNFRLSWDAGALRINGLLKMQARSVASRLSTLPDVGSYQLELHGGAQPSVALSTLRGPLAIQGQGHWEGSKFRFAGEAHAQPEQATELANLLTLLGMRRGDKTMIRWG